jgi:hypothetical protein
MMPHKCLPVGAISARWIQMEKRLSKQTRQNLKAIGLYQMLGAGVGIISVLWSLIKTEEIGISIIVIVLLAFFFFLYSLYCALLCLENKRSALIHSLINQSLQVVGFFLSGIGFFYVAGVYLAFVVDFKNAADIKLSFGLSQLAININTGFDLQEIQINLIAIGLIAWIVQIKRKIKYENAATVHMDVDSSWQVPANHTW